MTADERLRTVSFTKRGVRQLWGNLRCRTTRPSRPDRRVLMNGSRGRRLGGYTRGMRSQSRIRRGRLRSFFEKSVSLMLVLGDETSSICLAICQEQRADAASSSVVLIVESARSRSFRNSGQRTSVDAARTLDHEAPNLSLALKAAISIVLLRTPSVIKAQSSPIFFESLHWLPASCIYPSGGQLTVHVTDKTEEPASGHPITSTKQLFHSDE